MLKKTGYLRDFLIIAFVACLVLLPQILSKSVVLGSDAIFHFNRFYDTAQQIKTWHFNYFQSNFGFQQAGRIITPMYGPMFSYIFGLVLLFVGSWLKLQLLMNLFVLVFGGYGIYLLSRKVGSDDRIAVLIGILFLSSVSVSAWVLKQHFTSVGLIFIPYILFFGTSFIDSSRVNVIGLAISVAALVQTHFLSALFVVCALTVFFIVGLFVNANRKSMIIRTILSGLLAILLTMNIWFGLISVYGKNILLSTWPYTDLDAGSISLSFGVESETQLGLILSFAFIFQIVYVCMNFHKQSLYNKVFTLSGAFFLVLSSKLILWNRLEEIFPQLATLLQYPSRIRGIATILLLVGLAISVSEFGKNSKLASRYTRICLAVMATFTFFSLYANVNYAANKWYSDTPIGVTNAVVGVDKLNAEKVRNAFRSSDLSAGLRLVQKTTPDYLPVQSKYDNQEYVNLHPYGLVEKYLINNSAGFKKTTNKNGELIVTWNSTSSDKAVLPVVVYHESKIVLNGKTLNIKKVNLTKINNPILDQKKGANKLVLGIKAAKHFSLMLWITIMSWIVVIIVAIFIVVLSGKEKLKYHLTES